MSITICIPTCHRKQMLMECVHSIFQNKVRPIEIIISDDGCEPELETALNAINPPPGIRIKYLSNTEIKGQAGNTRNALAYATGELVSLIHDDDFFLPGALDLLYAALSDDPEAKAAYGRQIIVTANGSEEIELTASYNSNYFRSDKYLGRNDPVWAALVQQFPNNGWLARREVVENTTFPLEVEVGYTPVDFYFALALSQVSSGWFRLISSYVVAYRLSEVSVIRTKRKVSSEYDHLGYRRLTNLLPTTKLQAEALDIAKCRMAYKAIKAHISRGNGLEALKILIDRRLKVNAGFLMVARLILAAAFSAIGVREVGIRILKLGTHTTAA